MPQGEGFGGVCCFLNSNSIAVTHLLTGVFFLCDSSKEMSILLRIVVADRKGATMTEPWDGLDEQKS